MPPKIQAATAATRIDRKFTFAKLIVVSLFHHFIPLILQTIFHSSAVTGCTDRREYFTRAISLSLGSALIAASVTGFGNGLPASVCTAIQGSPFFAVGSGEASRII